ncbi:lysozyme [Phenylobacterium soli]|nr:lysozyme [Phenylobacterium soli]
MAAVFASAAIAAPLVVNREGWVTKTYSDPVEIPTACAGVTKGVVAGKTYTDEQCEQMTAQALVQHGLEVAHCLPENLPTDTRAAFLSFSYNIGSAGFCASRVAQLARAGRLGEACGALRLYVFAGKKKLPGLVARRAEEQALCERGLR